MNNFVNNPNLAANPVSVNVPRRYDVYLSTNKGRVRSGNEDNFAVNTVSRRLEDSEKSLSGTFLKEPLFCAVFDGMGGEANGELASLLSAEASEMIYRELQQNDMADIDELVGRFVVKSNDEIIKMLESNKAKRGGSTFVMTVFCRGCVYSYSLGDSRIYIYRGGKLSQISNDQTLAMKKLRANIFTEEEALMSPDRHKLTSFLGVDIDDDGLTPQIYRPFVLLPGDKLMLCSDGLYDMCADDQIEDIMRADSATACLALVDAALKNGGEDNVTCIIVECSAG